MSDLRDDYHATIESIAQDAQDIVKIEEKKASLDPTDPRTDALSEQAEEVAEQLHRKTHVQRDLAAEAD